MPNAVIVDLIRTPLGRRNGKLKDWHPVDLAAETLKALVDRTGIDPGIVDDVVMGCVMQVGEQAVNVARNAVLAAGWPETVPGTTIDRQCGSSQQAAHFAAQGVIAEAYDVVIACGVESMSRVPMGTSTGIGGAPFGPAMMQRYIEQNLYGVGGLVVTNDATYYNERRRLAEITAEKKLAAIYPRFGHVEAGGLMSYGPNEEYVATRAASFVVRILDGDSPADMPIEGPTRYELGINRKAAAAIDLALPASLMRKADRIVG